MNRTLEVIVTVLLAVGVAAFVVVLYHTAWIAGAPGEARAYALMLNVPLCTNTRLPVRFASALSTGRISSRRAAPARPRRMSRSLPDSG